MAKRGTHEKFIRMVYEMYGNDYTVLGHYKNSRTCIRMKHNVCGYDDWYPTPNTVQQGGGCPKCAGNLEGTTESFKQEVFDLVGDEYTVLGEYVKSYKEIRMKHNVCGYDDWCPTPARFKQGDRCPKCAGKLKGTTESFKQEVFDLVGDEYTVLGEYVNTDTPVRMKHNTCGYDDWYPTPHNFKSSGHRCPECSLKIRSDKHRLDTEKFKQEVFDLVGDEYTVLGEYIGDKDKIRMKHNICGYDDWYPKPNHFKNGNRCPKCANNGKPSNLEVEILEFIKSFYTKEIKINCTDVLSNHKELDIYIPAKKLAIEFDGLYWHSDINGKDKNYHLNKTIECLSKDIQLIHIFEDEWLYKHDIIESKLKYLLGYSKDLPKIRASKCFISEISSSDKNQFLNENHIQGEDKASIKLGLWYPINDEEDRLVAVMTFCKPRKALGQNKKSKYDYELSRFATDIEFHVYGAFDKLFKYFKENYEWKSIITYADRRWSKGGLYENTGFELDHVSEPNYWYCKNNNRFHRFGFRKSELKTKFPDLYNESSTEFEIMDKTGYTRIWDCGNLVYSYNHA